MALVTNTITAVPELGGNASIGTISQHAAQFAVFDLIAYLGAELEIVTFIVYGPGAIGGHVYPLVRVCNQVIQFPLTRLETYISHANKGNPVPRRRPHAPV